MEKQEIMDRLMKNLRQAVPGMTAQTLEPGQTMREVGANSLDIVDVISTTMREVKVSVPREQLSKIPNIGALVDVLYAAQTTH